MSTPHEILWALCQSRKSASKLLFWSPNEGKRGVGRGMKNFTTMLQEDTGIQSLQEIQTLMEDKNLWRLRVNDSIEKISPMGD